MKAAILSAVTRVLGLYSFAKGGQNEMSLQRVMKNTKSDQRMVIQKRVWAALFMMHNNQLKQLQPIRINSKVRDGRFHS